MDNEVGPKGQYVTWLVFEVLQFNTIQDNMHLTKSAKKKEGFDGKLVLIHATNQSGLIKLDSTMLIDKEADGTLSESEIIKFRILTRT